MAQSVTLLGFAGSLREGSYNKMLIRNAIEEAPEYLKINFFDLAGIPLYNYDIEQEGDPERVGQFKEAIKDADGLLISTPEYNHGVPAVTKNAIDWASRPPKDSPLDKKPAGILGASPGQTGTARGQSQLRQAFEFTNSYCMPKPEILVYRAHEKFDDSGNLTHERTREFLHDYLEELYNWVLNFK